MNVMNIYLRDVDNERQVPELGSFVVGVGDEDPHRLNNLKIETNILMHA